MSDNENPDYKQLKSDFGIQPAGPTPLGGDIHEGFNVDEDGNLSGGHTTLRIPGGQETRIDWTK
jgi:hypothetical protein